jgi:DMSO/TMAO reductase YedYZ molybdopterin-dependent catalytic subunit
MAGRRTNLALLGALAAASVTGALAFAIGTGANAWATVAHSVAGLAIALLTPWKSLIVRRGLRRRRPYTATSVLLALLVVVALTAGVLHSSGLVSHLGSVSAMQLHVGAALAALPVALWHVRTRRVRLHHTDMARRQALKAGALLGGSAVVYGGLESIVRLTSARGAERRFTGSYERGTMNPEAMPVTQWLDDRVPTVDGDRISIEISGRDWYIDELSRYDDRIRATLDCTGGWFAEQDWAGVWLDRVIAARREARSIEVVSVTGYSRRFPIADASKLLLATRVAGDALSPGHGYPARIVAPGRRGFWWVKWITRIETSDRPWWLQLPFPPT